ncbi:MAG: hypothetical protein ACRCYS_11865 [Beijerinckiaceae bacterium]
MATIPFTARAPFEDKATYAWANLLNGDDGQACGGIGSGDRTAQVTGIFGAGGTVIVEGSIDGVNWFQLRDPAGVAISFTAGGIRAVLECPPLIRPRVTAGDGTTSITALISVRR